MPRFEEISRKFCTLPFLFFLVLFIFGAYFFLGMGSLFPDVQYDFKIYLAIAQAMDSGQLLYQGATDTKNIGFFFAFYLFYKSYTLFFSDLSYIYIWAHIFLTLQYFAIAAMVFKFIGRTLNSRFWAFLTALSLILYLSLLEHAYIVNQPQLALFWPLGILLYLSGKNVLAGRNFFVLGLLLGGAFVFSTPYILLTLIVPILILKQDNKISAFIKYALTAFGGFLLALLPVFLYLFFTKTLDGWFYWNVQFLQVYATKGTSIPIPFVKNIIGMFFTLSDWPQTALIFTVSALSFGLWFFYLKSSLKHKKPVPPVLYFCLLNILPRLMLDKHHASYQIYLIPFSLIGSSLILAEASLKIKKPVIIIFALWIFLAWKAPASFYGGYEIPSYDPLTAAILKANKKSPFYCAGQGFYIYTAGKATEFSPFISLARFIVKESPDIVLGAPENWDFLAGLKNPRPYEQKLLEEYPLDFAEFPKFFAENYTQASPDLYIRTKSLPDWNTNVEPLPEPIKTLFPINGKRLKLPQKIKDFLNKIANK